MPSRALFCLSRRSLRGLRLALAGVAFPTSLLFAQSSDLPVSLPEDLLPELREILIRAAQQAPKVQFQNIESARLEANYITSRSSMLPAVYASGSYNWSESEVKDLPLSNSKSDGLFYNFYASQPIFHWGALKAQADIAKLEQLIGEQTHAEVYRELAVTLRSQYLGLILKKLAVRNQEFAQKMAEDYLAVQEERLANRTISTGEILGPRLAAEEARYYSITTRQDFEANVRLFAQLAGQPDFKSDRVPDLVPRPEFAPELLGEYLRQLSSEALRDLPQAEIYELKIAQNEKSYQIERARLLPKLSASASYGVSNITNATPTSVTQTPTVTTSLSVVGSWTLFDGFAARGGKLAALAAKRLNERYLENYIETVMNELRTLQGNVESAGTLMDLTERRLALAWEAVRLAKQDLELGRTSQPNVNNITNEAYNSDLRASNARTQFMSLWSQYVSRAGADPIMEEVPRSVTRASRR